MAGAASTVKKAPTAPRRPPTLAARPHRRVVDGDPIRNPTRPRHVLGIARGNGEREQPEQGARSLSRSVAPTKSSATASSSAVERSQAGRAIEQSWLEGSCAAAPGARHTWKARAARRAKAEVLVYVDESLARASCRARGDRGYGPANARAAAARRGQAGPPPTGAADPRGPAPQDSKRLQRWTADCAAGDVQEYFDRPQRSLPPKEASGQSRRRTCTPPSSSSGTVDGAAVARVAGSRR